MNDLLHLAETLCARLCHDLSGTLGALIVAAQVAAAENPSEAADATSDAASLLVGRLRLLRAAWAGDGAATTVADLEILVAGAPVGRKIAVDWSGLDPERVFSPAVSRVILNVVLLAIESLGGGGRAIVSEAADSAIVVTVEGPSAAWPAAFVACLGDDEAAWNALIAPESVQAPLTAMIARRNGVRLALLPGAEGAAAISLSLA